METNIPIARLRAVGFSRVNLTFQKLTELATYVNTANLHLPNLVECLSLLPQISEMQSSASTADSVAIFNARSLSSEVAHAPEIHTKQKHKKNRNKRKVSQIANTSQPEATGRPFYNLK